MNNLYVRLAKNNLKNNKSLYVPYMVAGMITVLMFYIMMFINNSAGLEKMRGAYYITTIMSFGVIVVGVFSYIYIFYTNSFISKRRKKEMGIYNILGMEKRHIAKVLAIETVFTAFVSIVGGIVDGILFQTGTYADLPDSGDSGDDRIFRSAVCREKYRAGVWYFVYDDAFLQSDADETGKSGGTFAGQQCGGKGAENEVAYGNFRSSMSRCGICNCHYDRAANESDQPVFCGSASGDRWNIHAVYGGQYCGVKAAAENPWILLQKKAFYRGIDDDVPDEAECGGAGKHLYFIDDGDGHGVYHGLYVCGF